MQLLLPLLTVIPSDHPRGLSKVSVWFVYGLCMVPVSNHTETLLKPYSKVTQTQNIKQIPSGSKDTGNIPLNQGTIWLDRIPRIIRSRNKTGSRLKLQKPIVSGENNFEYIFYFCLS